MSKDNYSDELRKVVTVCAGDWSGRFHDDAGDTDTLALLFCDRKRSLTRQEQMALMFHQDVRCLFSNFYYGMEIAFEGSGSSWHWQQHKPEIEDCPRMFYIVGGSQGLYPLKGATEKPFFLFRDEQLYETTMDAVHERCQLMQKFSDDGSGCRCSWHGAKCVHVWHTPGVVGSCFNSDQISFDFMKELLFLPPTKWMEANVVVLDRDDWDEHKKTYRIKNWKSLFAGHVFIPPTATSGSPLNPGSKAIRLPFNSNFAHLEGVRDDFSSRTKSGVATRRTIDKECRKCYLGGERKRFYSNDLVSTPCLEYQPRYCKHGAWTEERLVDYTLERFEAKLKQDGQFSLQDMWTVAQLAGIPFKLRAAQTNRKREWQICRIEEGGYGRPDPNKVRVLVARTARDARDRALPFTSLEELEAFLPPFLKDQLKHVAKKDINRKQLALWAHLAVLSTWKSRTGFFSSDRGCGFTSYQARIGAVFLVESDGVRVQQCWSRSEEYDTFYGFEALHASLNHLPLFNISSLEDPEHYPSFNQWLR